jgi:hypothetical protein
MCADKTKQDEPFDPHMLAALKQLFESTHGNGGNEPAEPPPLIGKQTERYTLKASMTFTKRKPTETEADPPIHIEADFERTIEAENIPAAPAPAAP